MSVHRLESSVLHYDWGSRSAIADVLARPASGKPEAEFWMGAHPKASSSLEVGGVRRALADLIEENPDSWIGAKNRERFGSRLPFLFKVLAAARPLSLQMHPTLEQARSGFSSEESLGIPRKAPERVFPDSSHKPELVCALGAFDALVGFRSAREALEALSEVGLGQAEHPFFATFCGFLNDPTTGGLRRFFAEILGATDAEARTAIDASVEAASRASSESGRLFLLLAAQYSSDAGAFLALLLNRIRLEPGEALFLPAGIIHAYLGGVALEVMASSDNVLRVGLTTKPLHRAAVLELARFEPYLPSILRPSPGRNGDVRELRFVTPAPEFELSLLDCAEPGGEAFVAGPALLLVLEGCFDVRSEDQRLTLQRGEHAFLRPGRGSLRGSGRVACVAVNPSA